MQPLGAFLEVMQLGGETPVPASAMVLEEVACRAAYARGKICVTWPPLPSSRAGFGGLRGTDTTFRETHQPSLHHTVWY